MDIEQQELLRDEIIKVEHALTSEIELLQSDIYLKQNQQFAENETFKQKKIVLEGEVLTLQSENAVKRAVIEQVRLMIELLKKIAEVKAQQLQQ